jgi:hypothetical protein
MGPASCFIFGSHSNGRPAAHRALVLADPAADALVRVYKGLLQPDMHSRRRFLPELCHGRSACQFDSVCLVSGDPQRILRSRGPNHKVVTAGQGPAGRGEI